MNIQFHYAARSDVGLVRANNQDSGYAGPRLLVLADGMGGPAGGDIASSVTVAQLAPLDDDVPPAKELLPLLRGAVDAAHEELMEYSASDPDLKGLGTTCIAILRSGNKLGMIHIGDSRAYLLRGTSLIQVTKDHTYVQHLVDLGRITPEQAETHPHRNMILRAIGDTNSEMILDESLREAVEGDRWMLCSDGLSGMITFDTIQDTLISIADPGECADRLVDLALKAGGTDNVTVLVCDVVNAEDSDVVVSTVPQIVGAAANKSFARSRAGISQSTPAAKAAALRPAPPVVEEAPPARPVRRIARWVATIAAVVAVIGGGLWGGYTWTQSQYYVAVEGGEVMIYQGIPQSLFGYPLSHVYESTGIPMNLLSGLAQDRLAEPITRPSLAEAQVVVETLRLELTTVNRGIGVIDPSELPGLLTPPATTDTGVPAQPGTTTSPAPDGTTGMTPGTGGSTTGTG